MQLRVKSGEGWELAIGFSNVYHRWHLPEKLMEWWWWERGFDVRDNIRIKVRQSVKVTVLRSFPTKGSKGKRQKLEDHVDSKYIFMLRDTPTMFVSWWTRSEGGGFDDVEKRADNWLSIFSSKQEGRGSSTQLSTCDRAQNCLSRPSVPGEHRCRSRLALVVGARRVLCWVIQFLKEVGSKTISWGWGWGGHWGSKAREGGMKKWCM